MAGHLFGNLLQWPKSLMPYGITRPQWVNSNCEGYGWMITQIIKHWYYNHKAMERSIVKQSAYGRHYMWESLLVIPGVPFYWHELSLIPAWIRNHMPVKCEMKLLIHSWTSMVQSLNRLHSTVQLLEVWEWMSDFIPDFMMDVITYPCWY